MGVSSVQAVVKVGDTLYPTSGEGRNAGVRSLGVLLEGSSVMGMTQASYEALSAEKKQAALLDRARQMFLEALRR